MTETIEDKRMQRVTENAKTTAKEALAILEECQRLGPTFMAQTVWANGRRGFGLRLDLGGIGRFGATVGWLCGLAMSPQAREFAEKAALDFVQSLDYLSNYGGMIEGDDTMPVYYVELGDDGLLNSYRLMWYRALPYDEYLAKHVGKAVLLQDSTNSPRREWHRTQAQYYVFAQSMNGGLIYNGPGQGETVSVSLTGSHRFWTVNT